MLEGRQENSIKGISDWSGMSRFDFCIKNISKWSSFPLFPSVRKISTKCQDQTGEGFLTEGNEVNQGIFFNSNL